MPSERPNILLILADSARPEVYGAYGGACRTPHLDRRAPEGVRFDRAYSASPICLVPPPYDRIHHPASIPLPGNLRRRTVRPSR